MTNVSDLTNDFAEEIAARIVERVSEGLKAVLSEETPEVSFAALSVRFQSAMSARHSWRVASRSVLKVAREERWRSRLKWL